MLQPYDKIYYPKPYKRGVLITLMGGRECFGKMW